ncbi:MAG: hypothetical protein QG629_730 [Patescibacteria group bacterium]|nr:hypothetical protein [Candidatus Saccharibacteria bacterium]MDQ5963647.1 hypothetical protein [Patescibacteria group bacterium]
METNHNQPMYEVFDSATKQVVNVVGSVSTANTVAVVCPTDMRFAMQRAATAEQAWQEARM